MTPSLRLKQHAKFKKNLGKKLFELRQKILNSNQKLMTLSEVHKESTNRRGGTLET